MSKKCQISGRSKVRGNAVSKSNIKTNRTFSPNLQTKRIINPATGKPMKIKLSTHSLKTLNKWTKEGKEFDLQKLLKK